MTLAQALFQRDGYQQAYEQECERHAAAELRAAQLENLLRALVDALDEHYGGPALGALDEARALLDGDSAPTRDTDAHLRDGRCCSVHDIDLVPPDRTLATRRYCPKCPPGSALGFPTWMVSGDSAPTEEE